MTAKHVRPRKLWGFVGNNEELTPQERQHLIGCEPCKQALRLLLAIDLPDEANKETGAMEKSA